MILTVEDMLNLPTLDKMSLVSGKEGINKSISAINVMDSPETFVWLKEGEFLLTSGYILKENPSLIKDMVEKLVNVKSSGLGFKTHRYFDEIPEEIIHASNIYNFPIVEIPYEYSFSYVSSIFNKEIYLATRKIVDQSLEMYEHFTNTALMGGGLDKISEELSIIIQNPVIIIDKSGLLLSYSEFKDNPLPLIDYLHLEEKEFVFHNDFFNIIKDSFNNSFRTKKIIMSISNGNHVALRIKPIVFTGEIHGYMVVWESNKTLNKMDYVTIQQATIVVSMDRLKQIAINAAIESERRNFFDDLLEGRINDIKALESLAQIHGLNINSTYVAMVTCVSNYSELAYKYNNRAPIMNMANKVMDEVNSIKGKSAIIINRSNYLISFIEVTDKDDISEIKAELKKLANDYLKAINSSLADFEVKITIGNIYSKIEDLRISVNEALETLKLLNTSNQDKNLAHYEDFKIINLLNSVGHKDLLTSFFNNTIGILETYDLENNTTLMETIKTFVKYNGNISQAAKNIFVHRNTFINRLDKIKQLTNSELKDSDELLEINLALKIGELLAINR